MFTRQQAQQGTEHIASDRAGLNIMEDGSSVDWGGSRVYES